MDESTAQTAEQTLPELIRFVLERMRGLQLEGPPTFQPEHYVNVWQYLAAAGNYLIDQIKDLRSKGHEQWETGDEASIQQFGRLSVPKGKEFLKAVTREMASLGTKSHLSSARAGIDTQPFDPYQVPFLVEFELPIEDVEREDCETGDVEKVAVQEDTVEEDVVEKEAIEPKVIKTEAVEPSPQDTVLPSIEPTNSFKTPTVPRPADYKTPPHGPSFSPITPPQAIAKNNTNSNNDSPNTASLRPPLQHPDDQRFQNYLSSINFNFNDDGLHSMFNFPTPTELQEETSPPPQLASQEPGPITAFALAEQ
ncbi:hypothetical protein MBLNU13_g06213t1 [Cladosporium sp. NU13]